MCETQKLFGEWSALAEVAMMGSTISIETEPQLRYIVHYVLTVLKGAEYADSKTTSIMLEKDNYNSKKEMVSHFAVSSTNFGVMFTFVRNRAGKKITSKNGVLAYVYNLDYPDCSELGYVFFADTPNGPRRQG